MQRDCRRNCRESQQHIKGSRTYRSKQRNSCKRLLENVWQGNEYQRRARIRLDTYRKGRRKNNQTGKHGYKRIDQTDTHSRLPEIGLFPEIRSISRQASHAKAQREERLPHGSKEHIRSHFTEIRLQQKFKPLFRSGQGNGTGGQQDNKNKKQRHHDFRRLFDAVLHPLHHNPMGYEQDNEQPKQRTERMLGEVLEHDHIIFGTFTGKSPGQSLPDIFERPACNHRIIAKNQETSQHAQIAYPFPECSGGKGIVSPSCARLRPASDGKFRYHDGEAENKDTAQIDEDKGCTSMIASFIRETPYISQSHS